MTRKRKTEARKKRKLKELDKQQQLKKSKLEKTAGGFYPGTPEVYSSEGGSSSLPTSDLSKKSR